MAKNDAYEPELFYLTDDKGLTCAYEVLDVVEYEGDEYAVLFSEENPAAGAVILRILPADDGDPETYVGVEENTMYAVFEEFRRLHKDELAK